MFFDTANHGAPRRFWLFALLIILAAAVLAGCGGKPEPYVRHYLLDYPTPPPQKVAQLPAEVKVMRFTSMSSLSSLDMVYAPGSTQRQSYTYDRWQTFPADMVGDILLRDLVTSGMFRAVFGPFALDNARFSIRGGVIDFQELDQGSSAKAQLSLEVTLMDGKQKDVLKKVMFQRRYSAMVPMAAQSAKALADSLSKAMSQLSPKIIGEIYAAVQQRLAEPLPDEEDTSQKK